MTNRSLLNFLSTQTFRDAQLRKVKVYHPIKSGATPGPFRLIQVRAIHRRHHRMPVKPSSHQKSLAHHRGRLQATPNLKLLRLQTKANGKKFAQSGLVDASATLRARKRIRYRITTFSPTIRNIHRVPFVQVQKCKMHRIDVLARRRTSEPTRKRCQKRLSLLTQSRSTT